MTKNKLFFVFLFSLLTLLYSCSSIRESAGVNRKLIDEYQSVENPPLIIPPDFELVPPEQIQEKNIEDAEKELAQEILFGLEDNKEISEKEFSTMNQILSQTEANEVSSDIRTEIDEKFSNKKKISKIIKKNWENESEILDAVKESERLRSKNFGEDFEDKEKVNTKKEKIKEKKKKRFFFF